MPYCRVVTSLLQGITLLQTTTWPAVQTHRHTFCIRVLTCPVASRSTSQQPMATAVTSTLRTPRQLISVLANTVFAAMTAMLPITRCCASPSFLCSLPAFHPRLAHVKCRCFCSPYVHHAESIVIQVMWHKSCLHWLCWSCVLTHLTHSNAVSNLYLAVRVMVCCSTKAIRQKLHLKCWVLTAAWREW